MDQILSKAGSQVVTFAIRSGISLASGYAIKTVSSYITKIPPKQREEIELLKEELGMKIDIISPAIELIKLHASRGNTQLESTLKLINDLTMDIDTFDDKIGGIATTPEGINKMKEYISGLIMRIEKAIPLLNLSLTTSGVKLSSGLPDHISPGRLIQASKYVTEADKKGDMVGPKFDFTLYSVFYNPAREEGSKVSWKEEYKRCQVFVEKSSDEYQYRLVMKEQFDDGRYHDEDEKEGSRTCSVVDISRIFFSASGKLLKLEDISSPVLVVKVKKGEAFEWLALGEYAEEEDSDEEDSDEEDGLPTPQLVTAPSLSLLEYIIRLVALQTADQKSILNVTDERLATYLEDENMSTASQRYTDEQLLQKFRQLML